MPTKCNKLFVVFKQLLNLNGYQKQLPDGL